MSEFLNGTVRGIINTFKGRNICWHLLAFSVTYILVIGGFDWWFFSITRGGVSNILGWSAGLIGFAVPVALPMVLYIAGRTVGNKDLLSVAMRVMQAGVVVLIIIVAYKAITGRIEPEFLATIATNDISRQFNFGFLQYGIYWGWPSAHTGMAFAMSVYLALWYRHKKWVVTFALLYASYIALGAGVSFHWFSDVVTGVILGSLVGFVVYKGSLPKSLENNQIILKV